MAWPSNRLLIGNGASEFIDLIMRLAPAGAYRTGPFIASYKEYERAAKVAGRTVIPHSDKATKAGVTVIIHPNSPSGEFMELPELEAVVQAAQAEGGVVLVDESFMPHMGPNWHDHSALALVEKYPATIIVVNSWTKIWCCPGLRLGSVACAEHWYKIMKKNQTPWSCNNMAQAFCAAVASDVEFQQQTWKLLPEWRQRQQGFITALGWTFNESSPLWVPWVFVDCGSAEVAERAAAVAQDAGCPVRWCASFGCPSRLRLGVRTPAQQDKLQEAWSKMLGK
jgi:histidinol-phosphate/aromatic aminotransferase/cobyric acid decarboxylase-like protein